MKVLSKTRVKQSPEKTKAKLQKELIVLERLQECANVVRLHGAFEDEHFAYIIMEQCSKDLENVLEVISVAVLVTCFGLPSVL